MAQVTKDVDYPQLGVDKNRGVLWTGTDEASPKCNSEFLLTKWGEPDKRATLANNIDTWTYYNGIKWVGAGPIILFPLPVFYVPSGREKITFGLKAGDVVFVKHETTNRTFVYLPINNDHDITVGLYYNSTKAAYGACRFKKSDAALAHSQSSIVSEGASVEQTAKTAAQGDATAQYALGDLYYTGKVVPRDVKVAIDWFSKAAAQGNAKAQYSLGVITYDGQNLPRDYKKAFNWFSMAAARGDLDAKYNLGVMYKNGEGTDKDLKKAFELFSETAEMGVKNAQIHLAGMYYFGDGVPIDYVQAYMWATISDQIDLRGFKGNYAASSVSRAAPIAKSMSSEQLARSKQLVNDWLSKHPASPDSGFR